MAPGLLVAEPQPGEINGRIEAGLGFLAVGLDTLMLVRGAQALARKWRGVGV
jgi:hypothetical protein